MQTLLVKTNTTTDCVVRLVWSYDYQGANPAQNNTSKRNRQALVESAFTLQPGGPFPLTLNSSGTYDGSSPNATTRFAWDMITYNLSNGTTSLNTDQIDGIETINVPILATISSYDSYGYPLTVSGVVKCCTFNTGLPANGDKPSCSGSTCNTTTATDGYDQIVQLYYGPQSKFYQPNSNPDCFNSSFKSYCYNITNFNVKLADYGYDLPVNYPAPQYKYNVNGLTLLPGVGFVLANVNVNTTNTTLNSAFSSNYVKSKVWVQSASGNAYSLNIQLYNATGNPSFMMIVNFTAVPGSSGILIQPAASSLTFPGLYQNVVTTLGIAPGDVKSVTLGLVLVSSNNPWYYTGINITP